MKDVVRTKLVNTILSELKDRYNLEQITEKKYDKLCKFVKNKLNTSFASFDLYESDDKDFCEFLENKILDDKYMHEILKKSDDLCGLLEYKLNAKDFIEEWTKIILAEKIVYQINDTYIYDIMSASNKVCYLVLNNGQYIFVTHCCWLHNALFLTFPNRQMDCVSTLSDNICYTIDRNISNYKRRFFAFKTKGDRGCMYVFKVNDDIRTIEGGAMLSEDKCHSQEDMIKEYYKYVISRDPKNFKNVESCYFRGRSTEFVRELLDIIENELNNRVSGNPSFEDKKYCDEVKAVIVEKLNYEAKLLESGKTYREENAEFFGEQKAKLKDSKKFNTNKGTRNKDSVDNEK